MQQTHENLMRQAIEVAESAVHCGEAPIGVVLFDDAGRRVAQGWNQRRSTGDVSRHAEMVAFASAAQPGEPQPQGMTLVSTLEPCVMCWGACLELKVARIVYGLEAPPNGGSRRVNDPERACEVDGPVLRNACRDLFVRWLDTHPDDPGCEFISELLNATAAGASR